jgi:predicted RNA binding protein YcfA (HicA-like mRNA interferase family)
MNFPKNVWQQLKNKSPKEFISALKRDGAQYEETRGATMAFRYPNGKRVVIHYHPDKTYGAKWTKLLIEDIGWTIDDLRRLKLVKWNKQVSVLECDSFHYEISD